MLTVQFSTLIYSRVNILRYVSFVFESPPHPSFLNVIFIFPCEAIVCLPQHNYQTMTAHFSFV